MSTKLLFESLKTFKNKSKVKHIVCASAIGIYKSSNDKIYNADSEFEGETYLQQVVLEWENQLVKFKKLNLNLTIFRIGLVLSENGGILKTLKIPTKLNFSAPIDGEQYQSWIHEYDLSKMIIESIDKKWFGIFN